MIVCALAALVLCDRAGAAVRIKDITSLQDLPAQNVLGYGLVVGLDGTGDSKQSLVALQTAANMLRKFGITIPAARIRLKNIAAVMVTATIPPFMPAGSRVDVQVSSMGDAKSLEGGTLLMTPLVDSRGALYARAQGAISIGGFNIESQGGDRIRKNYALVGRVPNGGALIQPSTISALPDSAIFLNLNQPDFTTAFRISQAIDKQFGEHVALALNAVQVRIIIPAAYRTKVSEFISIIEGLKVEPDVSARVVVNERTGTVVVGDNVTLSPVAIAHGNLRIEIQATPVISQPAPFSQGQTVVVPQTQTTVTDSNGRLLYMESSANVRDVARALNALGVSPRDIVAIFQALKEAGALKAELIIM